MAYCDRCGAYIPDGQGACLACGFDPDEESRKAAQAAAAQAKVEKQRENEREEAERRRAERQAYDRAWAEAEQRRRREEEEYRRREEERRSQEQTYDDGRVRVFVDPDGTKNVRVGDRVHVVVNPDGSKKVDIGSMARDFVNSDAVNRMEKGVEQAGSKILPLISYLGPLCFLSLIVGNDEFTKFHAKQGLKLFIASAILEGIGSAFGVGFAVAIFSLLMSIIGIKNVLNEEKKPLPYIGNWFN